jgi:hypothetical protein
MDKCLFGLYANKNVMGEGFWLAADCMLEGFSLFIWGTFVR